MKLPELDELYRRYRMDLYRYLCFLTHDPVQAEDLLSETFVRVIKRLPTFRGECEVKTWLFGIARNIWLESLRRRHQSVSLDDLMERYITDDALTETTAAEKGQEPETTGKGDGERGRERDRQQEDHTDFQTPGRHTLSPPFWVPPGPQSTRPHRRPPTHSHTHSPALTLWPGGGGWVSP